MSDAVTPLRVLYVNHTAAVSGAERSLLALLRALPCDVSARVASPRGPLTHAADELGVPTTRIQGTAGSLRAHPVHTPRTLAELALSAAAVRRAVAQHRPDVVHANTVRSGIVVGLARLAPPTVVHVRDCLPAGVLSRTTMRMIAASATVVVANSAYTARRAQALAPNVPITVIPSAIDLDRWDPARIDRGRARALLGVAGTRSLVFGVVAQVTPWKGQHTAVDALRLLRDEGLDAHLVLVGSAKFVNAATRFDNEAYAASLRRVVADAGLTDRVSWMGEREDVPELVRALDVLLVPSAEEPFGRTLIEAMALGVPVLATNVGGPTEIVRDGRDGYLLPPGEPRAWALALGRIAGDSALAARMGAEGRRRVEQCFTVDRHVAAVVDVYRQALA